MRVGEQVAKTRKRHACGKVCARGGGGRAAGGVVGGERKQKERGQERGGRRHGLKPSLRPRGLGHCARGEGAGPHVHRCTGTPSRRCVPPGLWQGRGQWTGLAVRSWSLKGAGVERGKNVELLVIRP
jgi:hypothetical protein